MSVSNKDFYFLTNTSTLFRYFVDNSTGQPKHYLYYPQKYETMSSKDIKKYEYKLVTKFLWWGIRNKQKMVTYDYQVCRSRFIDFAVVAIGTLVLAKFIRKFLFRQEFIVLEGELQRRNVDVRFTKAFVAYAVSFYFGSQEIKSTIKQRYLADLAIEYSPNFLPQGELSMKQLHPQLTQYTNKRFPWLTQPKQVKKTQ